MKRILLGVTAAALALSSVAANAQSYRGRDGGHYTQVQDRRGHDRDGRSWNGGNRSWNGGNRSWSGGGRYAQNNHWREGQVFSGYRDHRRMISDWGRYHLPPPRAGYAYYYDDDGGVVMAALASGLIGLALGDALSDQGYAAPYDYGYDSPYGYAPPPAPYGYPYSPY